MLAPWPQIDKWPLIIGQNITFSHISAACREALSGYRDRFVDVLDELLDAEPHGFSQLYKRVVAVAGGTFEINAIDPENPRAVEIAEAYRKQHELIPNKTVALGELAWGIYHGISAQEILWSANGPWRWSITGFQLVHSRRLSFPEYGTWDLFVWDQGAIDPHGFGGGAMRIKSFSHKFVVHRPSVRGQYSTREGLGRLLVYYFALKRLILRVSASEFERFIKPWVVAYFTTGFEAYPRPALQEDRDVARQAVEALGQGYSTSAVLPDSVKIELIGAVSTLNRDTFLEYLDQSITRACNGQSLTASAGRNGSRAANEVGERDEKRIHRFDANQLADTWHDQVIVPWVRLNYPGEEALAPVCKIGTEDDPDTAQVLDDAGAATDLGIEVDAEHIAKRANLPIARKGAKKLERPAPAAAPGEKGPPGKKAPPGKSNRAGSKPAPRAGQKAAKKE